MKRVNIKFQRSVRNDQAEKATLARLVIGLSAAERMYADEMHVCTDNY